MPRLVARCKKDRRLGEPQEPGQEEIDQLKVDARVQSIREWLPPGLAEVRGGTRRRSSGLLRTLLERDLDISSGGWR